MRISGYFILFLMISVFGHAESQIEPDVLYKEGERANNLVEREADFQKALQKYLSLEQEGDLSLSSGKFYYNLANTYFQLKAYPPAILYYYKALKLMPYEQKVIHNLEIALTAARLPPLKEKNSLFRFISFSLPKKLQLFFFCFLCFYLFVSLNLWFPRKEFKVICIMAFIPSLFFFLGATYDRYFAPQEAIFMRPVLLYRSPGEHYALARKEPLPPGLKATILSVEENGSWIKVETEEETWGYVKADAVRLI